MVWQKAKSLSCSIYRQFNVSKDFGFKDQIQRASVSIMNNIAEGFERQTDNEFRQSLYIAKGSCAEVRSMLYLARDLSKLDDSTFNVLSMKTIEVSKMLGGFIKALKS